MSSCSERTSWSDAAAKGFRRFFTGRPCRAGHLADRYVSNRQCVACNREKAVSREHAKGLRDPAYRMYRSVQRRSGQALRGRASPSEALGCDRERLKAHIESRFSEGMNWDAYGCWEVDHIAPLSSASSIGDLARLCHYENLQPLWKRENQMKGGA